MMTLARRSTWLDGRAASTDALAFIVFAGAGRWDGDTGRRGDHDRKRASDARRHLQSAQEDRRACCIQPFTSNGIINYRARILRLDKSPAYQGLA